MKSTFIVTVYNEQDTIAILLESLLNQTKLPDEIIIVDAKSKDNTLSEIEKFTSKFGKIAFRVLSKKGNRSAGRNFAIKNSKHQVIAATDAGCRLDKNWLRNILFPLSDKTVDVVAGYYKPTTKNVFEKSLATYTCVPEDKVTNDFLPSSRSIAFRKEAWDKVGGYPEKLDTCEDLFFARTLKRSGMKFFVAKRAIVYWPQRKNIIEAAVQFYEYALGDGQAHYIRSNTWFLFARYIVAVVLFFLFPKLLVLCFFLYILWSISKNYRYINKVQAILYLPILQLVSDVAVIVGTSIGFLSTISL